MDIEHTCVRDPILTGRTTSPRDADAGFMHMYFGFAYGIDIAATALSFSINFWATAFVRYKALYVPRPPPFARRCADGNDLECPRGS